MKMLPQIDDQTHKYVILKNLSYDLTAFVYKKPNCIIVLTQTW